MSWKKVKLGDICEITSSRRILAKNRTSIGVPFYCSKELILLKNGTKNIKSYYISTDKYKEICQTYGSIKKDDILITTRGTLGIPYLVKEKDEFYFGDGNISWLRNYSSSVNPRYLFYLLELYNINKVYYSAGAAIPFLSISYLKNLEIQFPPRPVQDKIAAILSAYDEMIDTCKQQIALLEEAAQRLYREWFVDMRFPGHETTPLGENGLPEGWEYTNLSEVADIVMGQSPASTFYNKDKVGLPFHQGVSSFGSNFVINDVYTSKWTKEALPNSILFSVRAPVGRINLTSQRIALGRGVASINSKRNIQEFLYHTLKHSFYRDNIIGNGTIFSSINKEQLMSVSVLNPPNHITEHYCKLATEYDQQLCVKDKNLKYLIEARDLLLPRLISGQIEITA